MKEIVETRNTKAVKSACRRALQSNGMLAVMADVGSGKTTLYNHLTEHWEEQPNKVAIVKIKTFRAKDGASRVPSLMKLMIAAVDPEAYIPNDVETRYATLERVLRANARTGRRAVVVAYDEAQDLSLQSFRDIKKVHEINGTDRSGKSLSHLFSVLFFGKTHRTWDRLFTLPELAHRIHRVKLDALSSDEIITFAENRFCLKFADARVRDRFPAVVRHRTPLGVQFIARALRHTEEFADVPEDHPIVLRRDHLQTLPLLSLKFLAKQMGLTQRQMADGAKADGISGANVQRINELMNGKLQGPLAEQLEASISKMLGQGDMVHAMRA